MRRVDLVSALKNNGVYTQQDVRGTCGTRLKKTKEMMGADLAALLDRRRLDAIHVEAGAADAEFANRTHGQQTIGCVEHVD